jgi:hypothetical protein
LARSVRSRRIEIVGRSRNWSSRRLADLELNEIAAREADHEQQVGR